MNQESDFKPEAIAYVQAYSRRTESLYSLRLIWMKFYASFSNNTDAWVDDADLLSKLRQSQDYFKNSVDVKYALDDYGSDPGNVSCKVWKSDFSDLGFYFWFELKVSDLPKNGDLKIVIRLDMDAMTLN